MTMVRNTILTQQQRKKTHQNHESTIIDRILQKRGTNLSKERRLEAKYEDKQRTCLLNCVAYIRESYILKGFTRTHL